MTVLDGRNAVERELASVENELALARGNREASLTRTRDALLAQRQSYERLASVWHDTRDRLELLNAQLDEAVARAVELSVHTGDISALNPLTDDVDTLVDELESLHLGLEEASSAG